MPAQRIERLREGDEIARDQSSTLMYQLVERVLPVRSRLAPVDSAGLIRDFCSVERNVLAVALHRQLLQICREPLQVLLERRSAEMLVHLVEAVQHGAEMIWSNGDHRRKADRRIHRVTAADPIPEREHIGGITAELRHSRRVRRYGDEGLRDGNFIPTQSSQ